VSAVVAPFILSRIYAVAQEATEATETR